MDFSFNEDQMLFQEYVREFCQTELAPGYMLRAKEEKVNPEILKKMAEFGLFGFGIPEEYGGQGVMDYVALGIALEEIGRADFSLGYTVLTAGLVQQIMLKYGSDAVKEKYLRAYVSGDTYVGIGLTEPQCGNDAAAIRATAHRDGDYYVLNGEKSSISFVTAPAHMIYAKTDPEAPGTSGISAFIVPIDMDDPGVSRSIFGDIGCKPIVRGSLNFRNYRIPADNILGVEGGGFKYVMHGFDYSRAALGLMCLGAAQAALDDAISYSKQRTAFGQPIAAFQGVSFPIAEDATLIEACKLLCYRTLWMRQNDIPHSKEAAMCKWWAPELSFNVCKHSLLTHGHTGYSDEVPQAQRMVDVLGLEIGDGTANLMKLLVAQHLIGRGVR